MKVTKLSPVASFLWQAWLPITLVVAWFAVSANSQSPFWPALTDIFGAMGTWATDGSLWSDLAFSFTNYFIALGISIVLGIGVGLTIGLLPRLHHVLSPYLDFLRSLPVVVFVPIIILTLGIGAAPKVLLITFACVWPILLNTIEGVLSVAPSIFETARAYRIPLHLRVFKVVLPGAMPQAVVGIRLAVTIGIVMLVVSEMYGSSQGVGYYILDSGASFKLRDTWAGTIVIGVIGWGLTALYGLLEYRLLRWHRRDDGPGAGGKQSREGKKK
jgi:ABC-type nitrate/sulfonate/bicarbonate transport system permease component